MRCNETGAVHLQKTLKIKGKSLFLGGTET